MNRPSIFSEDRILCSVAEATKALAIGRTTLYQMLNEGDLQSVMIGTRRLIKIESIEDFIERNTVAQNDNQLNEL